MIKPLHNNVLIKQLEAETKTSSGIIIPDSATEKPVIGEIIESASDKVKKGDKVYYKKWGGNEIKEGDKEYLAISVEDILAIIYD